MAEANNDGEETWRARAERLQVRVNELEAAHARDMEIIVAMRGELDELKRKVFGTSSEKMPSMRSEVRKATTAGKEKKHSGGRKSKDKAGDGEEKTKLTRREVQHTVPDDLKTCPKCGNAELKPLGEGKVSQLYELIRADFEQQRHIQETLACKCGEYVVTAPGPQRVSEKCLYGPNLCAHILVAKCADSIPLYRLEKRFKRAGIPLSRSTMCDLYHARAEQLRPLAAALLAEIARQPIVQADETIMRVMAPGKTRKSYLWTFRAGNLIAYVFSPTRSGDTPSVILGGTSGTLVVDGYSGYNAICEVDGRIRAGCTAHVRRKFFDALATAPEAKFVMDKILELYLVEHEALALRIVRTPQHTKLRQSKSRAILDELKEWLTEQQPKVLPKSPLGKAIGYALNQWEPLTVFVNDANVPLDNNDSENALRVAAMGRKNYLFVGHDRAGENTAVIYTLISTCEALGINPEAYLADVMMRIDDHPNSRISELLPHNWSPRTSPDP